MNNSLHYSRRIYIARGAGLAVRLRSRVDGKIPLMALTVALTLMVLAVRTGSGLRGGKNSHLQTVFKT